jgi:hypothetical protein
MMGRRRGRDQGLARVAGPASGSGHDGTKGSTTAQFVSWLRPTRSLLVGPGLVATTACERLLQRLMYRTPWPAHQTGRGPTGLTTDGIRSQCGYYTIRARRDLHGTSIFQIGSSHCMFHVPGPACSEARLAAKPIQGGQRE